MHAGLASHQADPFHPFIDEPGVLTGADMPITVNSAGKHIIVNRAAPPLEPGQQASPSVWERFELNRSARFLLHYDRASSGLPATDDVANLHLRQVTAPELAVDCQVEQRPISQAATLIEVESDFRKFASVSKRVSRQQSVRHSRLGV